MYTDSITQEQKVQEQEIQSNNQRNGGSNLLKIVIVLIVIIGIGAGSVFAYMQVNPLFLKSKKDIFEEIIVNSFDRLSQGNFVADNNIRINVVDGSLDSELNMEIPFTVSVSKITENTIPDVGISIEEFDISPIVDYSIGGLMPMDSLDNVLSAELKLFEDSVYVKANSVPEVLAMFFPVEDLINKYESKWVSSSIDEVESASGVELDSGDSLTEEQMDYVLERISQAIVYDANPVIESEKEGDHTKIIYTSDLVDLNTAMESAVVDIENHIGENDSTLEINSDFTENITGAYRQVLYVDKSLVINGIDTEILLTDNTSVDPINTNISLTSNYSYEDNVEIDVPESDFTFEELMGDVMMLMFMGIGGEQGMSELEGQTIPSDETTNVLDNLF